MKKLFSHMKDYRKECLLSPTAKLIEAALELIVPLVVASLIDKGIGGNDGGYVIKMCFMMAVLAAAGLSSTVVAQYFAAKAAVGFSARVRHALFAKLQSLSYGQQEKLGTATMLSRLTSDLNQVQSGVNWTLRLLLRSPFIVFGAMIMAFTIDVQAAMVFVVVIPLLFLVTFAVMLSSIPLYRKVQQRLDGVLSLTRENLSGVRVIRAFATQSREQQEFSRRNDALVHMQLVVGRVSALLNPATYVLVNLGIAWLVYRGAIRVQTGVLTQGAVVALYNYMSQILVELVKLANLILNLTKSIACAKRVAAVLEMKPDMTFPEAPVEPVDSLYQVEFENVSYVYPNSSAPALENVNLQVKKGQTVGIIGGTGCGKTTLVNLIGRFYEATAGAVRIDGVEVGAYPQKQLRQKIGLVPQKAVLFRGTIRENLRWGNENASDEELTEALKTAQALEVVASKGGLDALVEQEGRNFSGGQRQRLTIARALVRHPEILILDDSASALDLATDAALRQSLAQLAYHPTVFIISQRTASLQYADQIVVLDDGIVDAVGTHRQLLEKSAVYGEIYASQFRKEGEKQ